MERVVVDNVIKSYGKVEALRGVSFSVESGEIFGIIGADGAGKSSLFRILTTLLLADSGSATVDGYDVVKDYTKIRERVGYMPGRFSLYQDMSVEENLKFFASVFRTTVEENYHLIKDIYVQIEPFSKRRAGKLSGGMKQKLALCCALIHRPTILFLDEPTTGVDPVSRREFWQILHRLKQLGITILVSTPYMDEATLCDRIALIDNGAFLTINTPAGIRAGFSDKLYSVSGGNVAKLLKAVRGDRAVKSCYPFGEVLHVTMSEEGVEDLSRLHPGIIVNEIEATIEDCFLKLVSDGR